MFYLSLLLHLALSLLNFEYIRRMGKFIINVHIRGVEIFYPSNLLIAIGFVDVTKDMGLGL